MAPRTLLATIFVLATIAMFSPPSTAGEKDPPAPPPPTAQPPQPLQPTLPLPQAPPAPAPTQESALMRIIESLLGVERRPQPVQMPVGGAGPGTQPQPFTAVPSPSSPGGPLQFSFKIDPKTPIDKLLPIPPKSLARGSHLNEDLAKVPEITIAEPRSRTEQKEKAIKELAHTIAKINHLNQKNADGFMEALIAQRTDLQGMPYRMGDECRTCEAQAKIFGDIAEAINTAVRQTKGRDDSGIGEAMEKFWVDMGQLNVLLTQSGTREAKVRISRQNQEYYQRALVAALMQILMPESEHFRLGLARSLATIPHVDATRALANLALFSPEEEVRTAAVNGLKLRRERDYTDLLVQGFRYPLPAVSKRAAEALVKLDRQDLVPTLVEVLESPDPRLPAKKALEGKNVAVVRELVRVNHHRNCLLCHAPGNTGNVPDGVLKIAVPLESEPLVTPGEGGYQSVPPSPDILVRLDMTYLRQDFSMMMRVPDAHPWPDMQRFDFFVRTRQLSEKEAKAYEPAEQEPGRLSPYHRAALYALRELTGRDTEPTPQAWRRLLKLPGGQPRQTAPGAE